MRRAWAVAWFFALGAHPVLAAGYDSFAQGLTANLRGDHATAIVAFSAALNASDLAPAYVSTAYRGRAIAYLQTGRCQDALTDVNAAAAIRPLDPSGHMLRASIQICLKDSAGAEQELAAATGPEPDATLYWEFGRQLWDAGMFDQAHVHLLRSAELLDKKHKNQHAPFVLLWYAITAGRVGRLDPAKLSERLGTVDTYVDWPMPILKLFLGKLAPEKVWDKIDSPSSADYAGQKCEADFYVGEWYLAHDNAEAGKKVIATAVAGCPKNYLEYMSAVAEAKRLGLPHTQEMAP